MGTDDGADFFELSKTSCLVAQGAPALPSGAGSGEITGILQKLMDGTPADLAEDRRNDHEGDLAETEHSCG